MRLLFIIALTFILTDGLLAQSRIRGRAKSGKFEGARSGMITGGLSGQYLSANIAYSENISNKVTLNYMLGARMGNVNEAEYMGLSAELMISRYFWQSKRFLFVDFVYSFAVARDEVTIGSTRMGKYSPGGGLGFMAELYLLNNVVLAASIRQYYYHQGLVGNFRTSAQLGVRIFIGQ